MRFIQLNQKSHLKFWDLWKNSAFQNQHNWKYGPVPGPENVCKELQVSMEQIQNLKEKKNLISIHTPKSWTRSGSNELEQNMILKTTSNGLFECANLFF